MHAAFRISSRRGLRCRAFTLIEVLIVVVIMAVLAGVVITHFFDADSDARQSVVKHNLHILQSQIGLYNLNHLGKYPKLVGTGLPQLTQSTNEWGESGSGGPSFPYGPYVDVVPVNPFNESDRVVAVPQPRVTPTAPADSSSGWQYDEATGGIWPNHPEYFQ